MFKYKPFLFRNKKTTNQRGNKLNKTKKTHKVIEPNKNQKIIH